MIYELDEKNLLRIFQHTNFLELKRFIISLLQYNKSETIKKNIDIFASDPVLRVQALRSLEYHDQVARINNDILPFDIPFIIDSRIKVGMDTSVFIAPLIKLYEQTKMLWVGELLFKLCDENKHLLPNEISRELISFDFKSNNQIKICGITMIKSLSTSSKAIFDHLFKYCDEVIVSIPENQFTKKDKYNYKNLHFIKQPYVYNDSEIYKQLFREGRKIGATHFLRIDDDERIEVSLTPKMFKQICLKMKPGEAIAMPWSQIFGPMANLVLNFSELLKYSNIKNLAPIKDVVYCDDGEGEQTNLPFHCPWTPVGKPTKRYYLTYSLLHFEGTDLESLKNKFNRYLYWDYSINKNLNLIYQRYLPLLFRLLLVNKSETETLLLKHQLGDYSHVVKQLIPIRCDESVNKVKARFPISNPHHNLFVSDIVLHT